MGVLFPDCVCTDQMPCAFHAYQYPDLYKRVVQARRDHLVTEAGKLAAAQEWIAALVPFLEEVQAGEYPMDSGWADDLLEKARVILGGTA